jgi:hypothetical protein
MTVTQGALAITTTRPLPRLASGSEAVARRFDEAIEEGARDQGCGRTDG